MMRKASKCTDTYKGKSRIDNAVFLDNNPLWMKGLRKKFWHYS